MSLRATHPRLNQRLSLEMPIRGLSWTGVRFSAPPPSIPMRAMACAAVVRICVQTRGESNSGRGAKLRKARKRLYSAARKAARPPLRMRVREADTQDSPRLHHPFRCGRWHALPSSASAFVRAEHRTLRRVRALSEEPGGFFAASRRGRAPEARADSRGGYADPLRLHRAFASGRGIC